jgi:hypothetical protein
MTMTGPALPAPEFVERPAIRAQGLALLLHRQKHPGVGAPYLVGGHGTVERQIVFRDFDDALAAAHGHPLKRG